jgi:hypothetical protein
MECLLRAVDFITQAVSCAALHISKLESIRETFFWCHENGALLKYSPQSNIQFSVLPPNLVFSLLSAFVSKSQLYSWNSNSVDSNTALEFL